LNLGGAGLAVGALLDPARERDRPRPASIERDLREGDGAERERARAVLEERRPAFEALREARRAARGVVRAAAEAEPFDRAALHAALAELRRIEGEMLALRHDTFEALAAGVGPERRAAMVARFERMLDRPGGPGRGASPRGSARGAPPPD
ncbi:MAG: periplasmic heavy metal sensor, partial [Rubrimonas sp.]